MALTLRLLCGLTTGEVARAFLVSEPTMAARITRAKKKIAAARIPYQVPAASELPDRLAAVLDVVHLVFTTGHTAPAGPIPATPRPGRTSPRPGPHAARTSCPATKPSPGCSPSSCSPTPAATPAPPPTGGCCSWPSKTAPAGTGPRSTRGSP